MIKTEAPDNLEERFTEPKGFRWHSFTRDGRKIRFGSSFPQDSIPDAVVVVLPGLSEFGEKYYELARNLNDANLAFWVIDWMGQGGSGRYLPNPDIRHAASFDEDVEDLQYLILEYIKHSSVHPDKGRIPMAMLGHSMGGNIGLRYMQKYPDTFECAAFSAPMIGLKDFESVPQKLALGLAGLFNALIGKSYAFGQKNWNKTARPMPGHDTFSSDAERGSLHPRWQVKNPELRLGGVSFGWVFSALTSCLQVQKDMHNVQKDIMVGYAGNESIVSNKAIKDAFNALPNVTLIEYPHAQHEIMMERDITRSAFLNDFYDLIQKTIIDKPETLKPF